MDKDHFEKLLQSTVDSLNSEINSGSIPSTSKDFEYKVRKTLESLIRDSSVLIDFDPHPHVFPDIAVDTFGIEVKFTTKDTWRSVANSVFESTRNPNVLHIYYFWENGWYPRSKMGII